MVDDEPIGVHDGLAGFKCLLQGTVFLADVGLKDFTAGAVKGILATDTRGSLGGTIKRSNPPIQINGENPFIDRI